MSIANVLRRIIGVPDYETYVEHVRTHHPEKEPLPKEEFFRQRLKERYETPGNRCC